MQIKDSGKRETFDTGSKRDTEEGKPRFCLLPFKALWRVALHYTLGADKYGDHNWEKGQPYSRLFSSALRHLSQWVMGDREEDHLAAVVFNILAIIHFEEEGRTDLDDLSSPPALGYGKCALCSEVWDMDTLDRNEYGVKCSDCPVRNRIDNARERYQSDQQAPAPDFGVCCDSSCRAVWDMNDLPRDDQGNIRGVRCPACSHWNDLILARDRNTKGNGPISVVVSTSLPSPPIIPKHLGMCCRPQCEAVWDMRFLQQEARNCGEGIICPGCRSWNDGALAHARLIGAAKKEVYGESSR